MTMKQMRFSVDRNENPMEQITLNKNIPKKYLNSSARNITNKKKALLFII